MYSFSYSEPVCCFMSSSNCCPAVYWGHTVVEVMKIMVTSFKRPHACTATLSAPNPEAGHYWPTPLLETPEHSQANLGQSLGGHCSFLLGPGAQGSVCALQVSITQYCVSSGRSMVGLMVTSSKRAHAIPTSVAPRAPVHVAVHCWPICPQGMLKCWGPLMDRNLVVRSRR